MSKKSPQLRFKGFTDDWEDRKLKDILREFSTKSKIENEYRVLSSTNVGMEFRDGRVSGTSNLGYKIIKNGDLVLSPQNLWLGNININNIGTGLVSPSYKTFNFTDIDSSFIKPQLRTPKMLEEYKNSSTQGASVVRRNLEIDSFYQIKIATPSIKEQEKIGSFFKHLDALITLQQSKLDLLKEQKKGYLQKMFPKNGEKVPELRFAGFSDDWEQRKLGDITGYIKGYAFKSKDYQNDGYRIIRVSDLGKDNIRVSNDPIFVSEEIAKQQIRYSIKENEIIITTVGSKAEMKESAVGRPVIVTESSGYLLNQNLVKVYGKSKFNSYFIYTQLLQTRYTDYISMIERGNANQANIAINDLWNYRLLTPTYEEQQKIGAFFKQLDDTIALHQRKLDLLKQQKKGYLQKMFV